MNKVMFFANLLDVVGNEFLELALTGKTVADLKEILADKYPSLKLDTVMIAINEEFAVNDEVIHDGDIVALIPPVSGG